MAIFSEEEVLNILNTYNPWWKLGTIPEKYIKPIKRVAYYETEKMLEYEEVKRYILLSGARRVGKTTIMYQLIEKLLQRGVNSNNIIYMSLDNPILKFGTLDKIIDIYTNTFAPEGQVYIFLDEIQYSKDWDKWLKVFYDQQKQWKIIATGSASPLIEKGATESGVGRWITLTIPTLSFYEYCVLQERKNQENKETKEKVRKFLETYVIDKDIESVDIELTNVDKEILLKASMEAFFKSINDVDRIKQKLPEDFSISKLDEYTDKEFANILTSLEPIKKYFNKYLITGGFPELANVEDTYMAQKILREDIVDKVLKRDMPELFGIRNISVLEKVFLYLCFESSNIINYASMAQDLDGVSIPTLQDYIKYLESSNLIYISESLGINGTKILNRKPKIYVVDSAIRNAVLMKEDVLSNPTEMGYVVETAVYRHMYTYIKNTTGNIGYYREGKTDNEIDIVTNSVKNNIYLEVKYREKATVKKDNPIYKMNKESDKLFIILKNAKDSGILKLENGKKLVKIPAYAFLFLIGLEEIKDIEK